LTGVVAALHGIFQHWNVRTPRWIGYFVQRPESHCLHHERGVHARNYADFPLWDMLFGSFENPASFGGECGFDAPADRRLGAMLAWQDVNEPVLGSRSRGAGTLART
jgi:sterol desaturase/sphingolipid hydroxylase (fatty acid hydroxylase superfamily)